MSNALWKAQRFTIITISVLAVFCTSSPARAQKDHTATTLVHPPWKHTLGLHRVGQSHLDFYSGYRKKFSNPRGIAAVKHRFNDKEGSSDDDELTVYGVNAGTGEIFYNKSMTSLGFFGRPGSGDGQFDDAVDVAADEEGNVFVSDRGNRRVVRLRNTDNELAYVGSFDLSETGTPLASPTGICMEGGFLYVADSDNNRIVVTDIDGKFIGSIDGEGTLVDPFDVAVIADRKWNHYGSSFIVVSDSLHQRLTMMRLDGSLIDSRWFSSVSGRAGGYYFVAIDFYSNIYVTDEVGGCIYKFDRYLRYITRVGCDSGSDSDLREPRGITIYRRFGQIFVAERAGASYFWVGTDVENVVCTWQPTRRFVELNVKFLLTEHSDVTIALETESGKAAKTFVKDRFMEPGVISGRYQVYEYELPCPLANCDYVVTVTARPTYSSVKYHEVKQRARIRGRVRQ